MCQCKGYDAKALVLDIATPPNVRLRGIYKRSFAYFTIKNRLPKILMDTIDALINQKNDIGNEYGRVAKEELKSVVKEIWNLKIEMQMNGVLRLINSNMSHVKYFNDYLTIHPNITYYSAVWLFMESYMYKRINEIFESSLHLKSLDYFRIQKQESYASSINSIEQLGSYCISLLNCEDLDTKEAFMKLLKLNLWGNKADLSFGSGQVEEASDTLQLLNALEPCILCNDSEMIWNTIMSFSITSQIIDIVLDNCGYEVFSDFCLADFVLTNKLAKNIRMYVKIYPYYVSDVNSNDIDWMLQEMLQSPNDCMQKLGKRWTKYIKSNKITIIEDDFWITGIYYASMSDIKPALYKKLSEARLVMFKGDLNYRKLVGEKNWDPTTPMEVALEKFGPTKVCSLRIIKCDTVCGLERSVVKAIEKADPNWMINGMYGTIQFSSFVNKIDSCD